MKHLLIKYLLLILYTSVFTSSFGEPILKKYDHNIHKPLRSKMNNISGNQVKFTHTDYFLTPGWGAIECGNDSVSISVHMTSTSTEVIGNGPFTYNIISSLDHGFITISWDPSILKLGSFGSYGLFNQRNLYPWFRIIDFFIL